MQNEHAGGLLVDCPTRFAVEIIADKWSVLVLFALGQRPRRHGELIEVIGGVSRKVLTHALRRLQEYGLVDRRAQGRHVEYSLTPIGETLIEPIDALTSWARDNGSAILDFQADA
ncbi:helix-turn-helix domain-containing protein [Microbacterium sp. ARD32]|uniref:winged helix-turn-helix transcriptional regulator n=1 Tax=Microbacterium sp. ARD32 TaxID=2962577 RepID=UPI0028812CEB|nr:helix-turn-helix domain-containing protein [Microbacterium sp. ARD32]MDT0156200.1 helix-turn-helix domain-containing protein [Microbacterium sp. ARD32]